MTTPVPRFTWYTRMPSARSSAERTFFDVVLPRGARCGLALRRATHSRGPQQASLTCGGTRQAGPTHEPPRPAPGARISGRGSARRAAPRKLVRRLSCSDTRCAARRVYVGLSAAGCHLESRIGSSSCSSRASCARSGCTINDASVCTARGWYLIPMQNIHASVCPAVDGSIHLPSFLSTCMAPPAAAYAASTHIGWMGWAVVAVRRGTHAPRRTMRVHMTTSASVRRLRSGSEMSSTPPTSREKYLPVRTACWRIPDAVRDARREMPLFCAPLTHAAHYGRPRPPARPADSGTSSRRRGMRVLADGLLEVGGVQVVVARRRNRRVDRARAQRLRARGLRRAARVRWCCSVCGRQSEGFRSARE